MSRKKWPRFWIGPETICQESGAGLGLDICGAKTSHHIDEGMLVEEHEHILSAEHRLNAMGQERELALMARVKELEKKLAVAVQCLQEYSTAAFDINGQVFKVGSKALTALAAIEKEGRGGRVL